MDFVYWSAGLLVTRVQVSKVKSYWIFACISLQEDGLSRRLLRKSFLHLWGCGNHLQGIGGPGAPHVFCMDRRADLGHFGFDAFVNVKVYLL